MIPQMSEAAPKSPRPRNTVLETLAASFAVFRDCLPLAIGIHKTIRERLPEIEPQQLRAAMRIHTASTRYLKALSQAAVRVDLDGGPAGEVTAEQRQQAVDTLRERFRSQAERHRAAQLAQQQQELAQQQERQRQEKLLLLAAKFNSR